MWGQNTGCHEDVATTALLHRLAALLEQIAQVIRALPQEPTQERVVEQIVATLVPQRWKMIVEVTQPAPQERIHQCIVEDFGAVHVPQIQE